MKPESGWYPVKLESRPGGECVLHWQNLTAASFAEPFFEDTMRRSQGSRELRQTVFPADEGMALPPPVPPTAFIFHASRSGSTLLTQLLSCMPGCLALSEPPVLDEVLQVAPSGEAKIALLRQVVHALGQRRRGEDRCFFLKHDSWHLPWLPLVQQAFPGTPCWFIYRRPEEILWSHHRQRGSQMVPGLRDPALFGIEPGSFHPADLDAYAARVLESVFTHALHHVNEGRLIPLEYRRLVHDPAGVLRQLGLPLTDGEEESIRARSRFHSKHPGDAFARGSEPPPLSGELQARFHELAAPRLTPLYEKLEALQHAAAAPVQATPADCSHGIRQMPVRPCAGLRSPAGGTPCPMQFNLPVPSCLTPPALPPNPAESSATSATCGGRLQEQDTCEPAGMTYEELWQMIERNMGHPLTPVTGW